MSEASERTILEEADARRIDAYLAGVTAAFDTVERWIRQEIEVRYPVLSHELDDLCQVVHAKLLMNLRAGRFHRRSTLRTYISGITHHTAVDLIRRLYRERALPAARAGEALHPGRDDSPYRSLARLEERQILHQAVLRTPAGCRALWRMIFLEELSYEAIAARLDIPAGTVKSRVWHCRQKARTLLQRLRLSQGQGSVPGGER